MSEDDNDFRTNDMACAAFMSMNGHPVQSVRVIDGTCWWYFMDVPALRERLNEWGAHEARVDPREFTREFGQIKRSMHMALSGRAD